MGKPKAPKPPDYAAAAEEQGKANVNSAIATNFLNQVGQQGPYGSLSYSYDPSKGYKLPDGTIIPAVTATTTLSPEQQKLLDQNNQISQTMNQLALQGLDYAGDSITQPIDVSKLPAFAQGLARTSFSGEIDPTMAIQGNYDFSGASRMPTLDDFKGQRDQITDAMMQRLQPYLDKERAAMDTRLATQGITKGSEAYSWDNDVFNRGANDQRIAALLAGDQQQQNLFANAMGLRQQGVSEAMAQGDFRNQAQAQQFGQNYNRAQFGNQAAEATFAQGLASGQFQNQARAQALQEADYLRNAPINILNALRSGNQVNMPQFGNVAGGAQIQAAPIYNAAQDQFAAAQQNYQNQMGGWNALLGGLGTIGGAAITKFSDPMLKSDMVKIGRRADGLNVYAYDIFGQKEIGVNAHEVMIHRPDALGPMVNGYLTVNYGKLG